MEIILIVYRGKKKTKQLLALAHAKSCLEKLKDILRNLSKQIQSLKLKEKLHRLYLGYDLVNIGETANEIIQCIKPEIIEGKTEIDHSPIELLLKQLKQCRKLIKAKPEYILVESALLNELNKNLCLNVDNLIKYLTNLIQI